MDHDSVTEQKVRALLTEAETLRAADQPEAAKGRLEQAVKLSTGLKESLAAEARIRLADVCFLLNQTEAAAEAIQPLLDNPSSAEWRARALIRFAKARYYEGDTLATADACATAVQTLAPLDLHQDVASAFLWHGHALKSLGKTESARISLQDSAAAAKRASDKDGQANALSSLGHLELRHKVRNAVELFRVACDLHRQIGHRPSSAKSLLHLSIAELRAGEWDAAERHLREHQDLVRSLGANVGLSLSLSMTARLQRIRNESPEATLDEADLFASRSNYVQATLVVLLERTALAISRGDWPKAEDYIKTASDIQRARTVATGLEYDFLLELARIRLHSGKARTAERLAADSYNAAAKADDRISATNARRFLAELCHSEGRYREAQKHIEHAISELTYVGSRYELLLSHRVAAQVQLDAARRKYHQLEASSLETFLKLTPAVPQQPVPRVAPLQEPSIGNDVETTLEQEQVVEHIEGSLVVQGEPGVDLGIAARKIQTTGPLRRRRLEALNGAALPPDLFQQQLQQLSAPSKDAPEGPKVCLLLQHVERISVESQVTLLRTLQSGSSSGWSPDDPAAPIHAICTTNRALVDLVATGLFLDDLYDRLGGFVFRALPLRERADDIRKTLDALYPQGTPEVVESAFLAYDWPGNDYELRQVVRATKTADRVSLDYFPNEIKATIEQESTLPDKISRLERKEIEAALRQCDGNKKQAALVLGVSRKGLIDRLKRLDLWPEYRSGQRDHASKF